MAIFSRADLRPLHDVNFRRYYIGQTLSGFGDTLVPLALSFVVLGLTHSVAALGFVLTASRLPIAVFTLFGGVLGDRLRRREVMVVADLVRLAVHGMTAVLLLTSHAQLWHLIVLQGVAGGATAFFNPAATGLVSRLVDKDQLQAANSLLGISRSVLTLLSLGVSATLMPFFDGVPEQILCDNPKTVVIERNAFGEGRHRYNPYLLDVTKHYGIGSSSAHRTERRPKEKSSAFTVTYAARSSIRCRPVNTSSSTSCKQIKRYERG